MTADSPKNVPRVGVSERADDSATPASPARGDRAVGVVVCLLALGILVQARGISDSSYSNSALSPRDFPVLIGVLMLAAGVWMLAKPVMTRLRFRGKQPIVPASTDDEPAPTTVRSDPRVLLLLLVLLLVYMQLLIPLGYMISTTLFLAVLTLGLARHHVIRNLVFSVAFAFVVYALFTYAIGVPLPPGPFGGIL